jgi:uncharacterized protein DUF3311
MNKVIAILLFIILLVLHQDFWNWDNERLVFGFMPVGLAYHAAVSIGAALLGAWACFFCWPSDLEEDAEGGPS